MIISTASQRVEGFDGEPICNICDDFSITRKSTIESTASWFPPAYGEQKLKLLLMQRLLSGQQHS